MATNPIQRQKRNSFLLGMTVTLLVAGIAIALLFMQLINMKKEQEAIEQSYREVYVLPNDIKSGEKIEFSSLKKLEAVKDVVPSDAVAAGTFLDEEGNLREDIMSKINIKAGTILSVEMLALDGQVTSDLRKQEYNMIALPSQIESGDYIDIRLRLGNGQDFIVVSKKKVTIPQVGGVDSAESIWINLTEGETLTMSNAIVDAFRMKTAELYATTYVEPGIQAVATPNYVVSGETLALIESNPNIEEQARSVLANRMRGNSGLRNDGINKELQKYTEDGDTNLETKVEDHLTRGKEERINYLDALNGTTVP